MRFERLQVGGAADVGDPRPDRDARGDLGDDRVRDGEDDELGAGIDGSPVGDHEASVAEATADCATSSPGADDVDGPEHAEQSTAGTLPA